MLKVEFTMQKPEKSPISGRIEGLTREENYDKLIYCVSMDENPLLRGLRWKSAGFFRISPKCHAKMTFEPRSFLKFNGGVRRGKAVPERSGGSTLEDRGD